MSVKLTGPRFLENPNPSFDELRQQGAVVRIKLPMIGNVWMTTTHAATSDMLKDSERFVMRKPGGGGVAGLQWWMPKSLRLLAKNMLTSDDPDHRRLRQLVDQAFQRRPVRHLEEQTRTMARDLLAQCDTASGFNLVDAYARQLPMAVIAQLLGLDGEDKRRFAERASKMTSVNGAWGFFRMLPAIRTMRKDMEIILAREAEAQSRGQGGQGLIAELVRAEHEGDRLSPDELVAMVFMLLMAGSETTTHMISLSIWALEQHPKQKALFLSGENQGLAIEELLRFCSPVQFSKPRFVSEAGDFHGADLKQNDLIMAGLATANMDPDVFEDPQTLDLTRKPNPHLEFGTGIHFCLGFQLARLEIQCALEELYRTMPDLRIAAPVTWRKGVGLRGLSRLPIQA